MTQSNTSPQLIELLNKVGDLLATRQQIKQQEVVRLITDTTPHIARIEEDSNKNALKFNLFSALGVTRKEVIQSRFLSYLLDPNEHHCQGAIFLNAFLTIIGLPEVNTVQIKHVRVVTEHSAGEALGRMDIVLFCQPDWLIVIENKVDAGEGDQQLDRYAKWLSKQKGYSDNSKRLVFLTPTGHESVTAKAVEYLQLSYLEIAEAFGPLPNQSMAESVRIVLSQYITMCKQIAGMDMAIQDKQLLELLTKPENIKIALEIEQQTQLIRYQVVKEFGEHLQKILQSKLESANLRTIWEAFSIVYNPDLNLNVEIRTVKHRAKPNYFMFASNIFYKSKDKGMFGWISPQKIDRNNQASTALEITELTNRMTNAGCYNVTNSLWVARKELQNEKIGFVTTDIDDILACLTDNQSEDHPLANTIAQVLWEMFASYRENIEVMDSFKQAYS